ncbi:HD-GYP domain-containing protein [Brevibacillus dissolubilis]|uniref:HD-GYP domain-containing protein n=1 Tax=Brevibacillus dissolubilis TaxID=1844116 RepID=UPI001116EB21|nr:HD-GYP domain-containing protein [Brevibacillus dissolubilis]
MPQITTDFSAVGKILEEDIHNTHGLLLLTKGTVLTPSDVNLLLGHKVSSIRVSTPSDFKLFGPKEENGESITFQIYDVLGQYEETAEKYVQAMEQTRELFSKVTEVYIPPLQQFTNAFFPMLDQVIKQTGIFHPIYLVEGSENYTYRHSINVGILCALIAKLMNRTREEVILMGQAGLLHDIGKMLIPQHILMKPTNLTSDEYDTMKKHTIYGHDLLQKMEGSNELISLCALLHHERRDGSGYPHGRRGSNIPLECQIVAVADVFDAICSDRVYKPRTSPFEAAQLLWKATCEGQFNAEIVTRFINYIALLYVGCRAVLNTGDEVEVVLIHTDEPMRPLVRKGLEYMDLRFNRRVMIEKMIG